MLPRSDPPRLGERLEQELLNLNLPDFVARTEVETGIDAAGETSAWVWLIVNDRYASTPEQREALDALRERIRDAAGHIEQGLWAYTRLRHINEIT